MRGRRAGAEATHSAVEASTTAQSATLNLVSWFNPAESRIHEHTTLIKAIANRNLTL